MLAQRSLQREERPGPWKRSARWLVGSGLISKNEVPAYHFNVGLTVRRRSSTAATILSGRHLRPLPQTTPLPTRKRPMAPPPDQYARDLQLDRASDGGQRGVGFAETSERGNSRSRTGHTSITRGSPITIRTRASEAPTTGVNKRKSRVPTLSVEHVRLPNCRAVSAGLIAGVPAKRTTSSVGLAP